MIGRRSFLTLGAASVSATLAQTTPPQAPAQTAAAAPPASPFTDPDFGFVALSVLGGAYSHGADPGKVLAIVSRIKPGDFESAFAAYHEAGVEAQARADQALAGRHKVSAREAYLWAANYFHFAVRFLDGTNDPERALPCWKQYAACWSAAAALFEPAAERIEIPYENAALTAWLFRADGSGRRRPLVILNTGADGQESRTYALGGAGALARGFHCLILNGPGQSDSLWSRKLYFRPDWEKVIGPVCDAMVKRPDVDAKRMALVGASMGGYWVPRALAFEKRIAAGVADPGVWDVSAPFLEHAPQFLRSMLRDGKKAAFDQVLEMGIAKDPRNRMMMRFRMRPFGFTSYYDLFTAVQAYNLADVAGRIACPMLITDPEGEQFFPGQAQKLYDALECPKKLIRFTHEEGAGEHCEVAAPGLRDCAIYDWLEETLA